MSDLRKAKNGTFGVLIHATFTLHLKFFRNQMFPTKQFKNKMPHLEISLNYEIEYFTITQAGKAM